MKHKKYHLIYFFSLLFFILSLLSTTPAQTSYLDSLDGKFALQFQIGENFTLSNFQGAIFSGKYHVGIREAIRLGISLDFSEVNTERDDFYFMNDSTTQGGNEGNDFMVDFRFQYINYIITMDDISFFGGIGPFVYYLNRETTEPRSYPMEYVAEYRLEDLRIGLDLLIGVEWMFNKQMSLSAEYGLLLYYGNIHDVRTQDSYQPVKRTSNSDSFNISWDQVKFGISIYF
jgi:hypothetical protein